MTIEALPRPRYVGSPFTPIGYTAGGQPVYPVQGGRSGGGVEFLVDDSDGDDDPFDGDDGNEDDDEDDDGDEDDDDSPARRRTSRRQDDADGEDDTDWVPPDREAWERVQSALKRANSEAGKRRRVGKAMDRLGITDLEAWLTKRGIDPETGDPYGSDVVDPDDDDTFEVDDDYEREDDRRRDRDERTRDREIVRKVRAAEQRGRAAERDVLLPLLAEVTARASLRDAGFIGSPKQLDRMLKSIDPRDLEVEADDEGFELVGMEEAIEQLREDFPEMFEDSEKPRRRARPSGGAGTGTRSRGAREVDGGNRGRQPAKPKGWREVMADQMMNGRR